MPAAVTDAGPSSCRAAVSAAVAATASCTPASAATGASAGTASAPCASAAAASTAAVRQRGTRGQDDDRNRYEQGTRDHREASFVKVALQQRTARAGSAKRA